MNRSNPSSLAAQPPLTALRWVLFGMLISPLLYYWLYSIVLNPSQNYFTNDAEFPHFINSLAVFKGGRYGYIDHPGTPVQVLGTILLGVMYPFTQDAPGGFAAYYLQEPGRFLDVAHAVLMLLYLLATCFFFKVARSDNGWKDAFFAIGLSVLYYAIHPGSLSASTVWNHNSFNFPIGVTLLLFLYRSLATARQEMRAGTLIALGMGAGIMTAITIYMAGWIIGIVLSVLIYYLLQKKSWTHILFAAGLTGLSAMGGFFLAVLPIMDKMAHFRNWIVSLLTHESPYLSVPEDQPRLERLYSNLIQFYDILPVLFLSFVLLVIVSLVLLILFRRKLAVNPGSWAIIIGLGVQASAILLMFLDRPLNESYFLSIATILPIWAMAILELLRPYQKLTNLLQTGLVAFALIGMTVTAVNSVNAKRNEVSMLNQSRTMIASTIRSVAQQTGRSPEDITTLWMHNSYSNCWGLRLGNSKAYDIFTKEIERICPRQYILSPGLRVGKFGNNYRIEEENWDIIFACERNLRRIRELPLTLHAEVHSELEWNCGNPVAVTHE